MSRNDLYKKDYYTVLGVSQRASTDEIKKAFKQLALQYHPDRKGSDPGAEEKFKEFSEAYGVLINPEKRARYDRLRNAQFYQTTGDRRQAASQTGGYRTVYTNPSTNDPFTDLFYELRSKGVRFENLFSEQILFGKKGAFFGGAFFIDPETLHGSSPQTDHPTATISNHDRYKSKGFLSRIGEKIREFFLRQGGSGSEDRSKDLHFTLSISLSEAVRGGEKRISLKRPRGTETLLVKIPPGIKSGTQLRLKGRGKRGDPGERPGNLYFTIRIH